MKKYDVLDFRLQSYEDKFILVTMLINNVPLYDCIASQYVEFNFETDEERERELLKFYNLKTYPEELDKFDFDEMMFYYNYPPNVMPIDSKSAMIGLSAYESFMSFGGVLFESYDFQLDEKYSLESYELANYLEKGGVVCLTHCCGLQDCDLIQMNIDRLEEDETIKWHNFKWWDKPLEHVTFEFKEKNYISVMKRLKEITDNMNSYDNYSSSRPLDLDDDYPF